MGDFAYLLWAGMEYQMAAAWNLVSFRQEKTKKIQRNFPELVKASRKNPKAHRGNVKCIRNKPYFPITDANG
ncbi:MAG TPA: hypothetical protein DHW25_02825 [Blautia sp.]|nr:hypothetical protein [Blautia sp.]